jgi:hypothetical protein
MPTCPACDYYFAAQTHGDGFMEFDPDDVEVASGAEVFDLIAVAALTSPHAAQAYQLLRDINPAILPLEARQRLIAARTKES